MVDPTQFQLVQPGIELLNNLSEVGRNPGSVGGQINLKFIQIKTLP